MDFETQTTATIEKPEVSGIPKEILDMYVVPGYEEEYTEHSLQRYRRESEKLERDMAEANHILQSSDFSNVKAEIIPMLLTMATQEQMQELMNRGFETNDPAVMLAAAEAIGYAEKSERSILIKTAFETNDPAVMLAAAEAIGYAEKSEQSDLRVKLASVIRSAFETNDPAVMLAAAEAIGYAEKSERSILIKTAFETNDPAVMLAAAEAIWYAKKSEQSDLRVKLASVIRSAFETNDPAVMLAATKAIGYAEESEQSDLRVKLASVIRSAFETNDPAVMLAAAKMIRYAKKSDWAELYALALERIGPSSVEGPLYEKTLVGFGRENFKKTGSETTLLGMVAGNDLKGKIIVRKFEMSSFLGWKRLYDDHAFWKGNGFDYVPIEPIVSFSVRKTGKVDVYSGVLDFSLLECRERGLKTWESELEEDRDKIIDAIKEGGYNHGHPHDKNFCLRFCRKDDGNIDYSKKPRIYLIDFDQVSSSKSRK